MTDRHQPVEPVTAALPVTPAWLHAPWRHKPLLKLLAIWMIASPLGAFALYGVLFPGERTLDLLAQRGVQTTGVVRQAHPGEDGDITVRFRVAGAEYDARGASRPPNRESAQLRDGDRVAVTYDREDPTRACACQPHLVKRTPLGMGFLVWFVAGFGSVVGYVAWRRRELRDRSIAGVVLERVARLANGGARLALSSPRRSRRG